MGDNVPRADDYFEASQSRFQEAVSLYKNNFYVGAAYLAGCPIEATFWAFVPPERELGQRGRHNLQQLYEAGLGERIDARYRERFRSGASVGEHAIKLKDLSRQISANLTIASTRWANSYRYYPESRILNIAKKLARRKKDSKDPLKRTVNELLDASKFFVGLGIQKRAWIV